MMRGRLLTSSAGVAPSGSGGVAGHSATARRAGAKRGLLRGRSRRAIGLVAAAGALGVVVLLSLAVGSKSIPLATVLESYTSYDAANPDHLVVRSLRESRTEIGLLVGLALGLSGAVMQGVARNPLADPGILGVSGGSALFLVVGIYVFGVTSPLGYLWFAFAGAAVAGALVYGIGSIGREGATPVKLALAGAALTAVLTSFTTTILLLDLESLDRFRFWVAGSLTGPSGSIASTVLPFIALGVVMALAAGRILNALALGDDAARGLGVRVGRARLFAAGSVVLLCGAATAAAGPIVFVGLAVPHIARAITGPDYRWVLPYSGLLAAIVLLSADIGGRIIAQPGEVNVGVVTAVVGAPAFIALVRRRKLAEL